MIMTPIVTCTLAGAGMERKFVSLLALKGIGGGLYVVNVYS